MKQTLSKLVDVILQKLAEEPGSSPSEGGLRTWLLRQGYAQPDIDAAMSVVRRGGVGPIQPSESRLGKVRHLSDYEEFRLLPEARAALARLEMYELIEPQEREAMLERLDQFEGPIGLADLEYLVNWVVCPTRDVETQQTIYQVLDGRSGAGH
jgi:hypothetical protein